jgi:hypothetical protein
MNLNVDLEFLELLKTYQATKTISLIN